MSGTTSRRIVWHGSEFRSAVFAGASRCSLSELLLVRTHYYVRPFRRTAKAQRLEMTWWRWSWTGKTFDDGATKASVLTRERALDSLSSTAGGPSASSGTNERMSVSALWPLRRRTTGPQCESVCRSRGTNRVRGARSLTLCITITYLGTLRDRTTPTSGSEHR